jgi:hypothetical protein
VKELLISPPLHTHTHTHTPPRLSLASKHTSFEIFLPRPDLEIDDYEFKAPYFTITTKLMFLEKILASK